MAWRKAGSGIWFRALKSAAIMVCGLDWLTELLLPSLIGMSALAQ
jgi:hypothetical protein